MKLAEELEQLEKRKSRMVRDNAFGIQTILIVRDFVRDAPDGLKFMDWTLDEIIDRVTTEKQRLRGQMAEGER